MNLISYGAAGAEERQQYADNGIKKYFILDDYCYWHQLKAPAPCMHQH